ncbi:terpenoid synthase [Ophiostoma piceae UAMH 11346]|uniref:Terpene synthase n=1 Tax=Ophiostoma piceae (strain UAMH 11346) TaxID=1262450 RepID=S3CDG0_OPHP1|nr:terpenoid synthase [Ophiostoma piceae UAMH 11346]
MIFVCKNRPLSHAIYISLATLLPIHIHIICLHLPLFFSSLPFISSISTTTYPLLFNLTSLPCLLSIFNMATTMRDVPTLAVDLSRVDEVESDTLTATAAQSLDMVDVEHPKMLHIPDTLADWPWPRFPNPHYDEVAEQSREWLRSFNAFPSRVQNAFDACDFNHFRITCDVMNVFFVIEEYTDEATAEETAKVAAMVMDGLRNPHTPRSEEEKKTCLAGEISRQFWENAVRTASHSAQTRFVATFHTYTQSVIREAEDRNKESSTKHTVDSYLQLRRETVGCLPSFALLGLATENLTDDVINHPLVDALSQLATELILLGNDIVSYNKERKGGAVHNLVTIVLNNPPSTHAYISTPQQAINWIYEYHDVLAKHFVRVYDAIKYMYEPGSQHESTSVKSSVGSSVDAVMSSSPTLVADSAGVALTSEEKVALLDYVEGLGNWVRGNDQWSFESLRYFGKNGPQVQKTRLVELTPLGKQEQ